MLHADGSYAKSKWLSFILWNKKKAKKKKPKLNSEVFKNKVRGELRS